MMQSLILPLLVSFLSAQQSGHLPAAPAPEPVAVPEASCDGVAVQGGLIICKAAPGTRFTLGSTQLITDETGAVAFGLGRKLTSPITIDTRSATGTVSRFQLAIAARQDETATLTGIDCDKIDARTEEQKAHASRSWVKKQTGWNTFHAGQGALDGFIRPAEGIVSSPFGYIRKYITEGCPTKERPHFGYDIAAPTGAPVIAPAAGTVTLAEDDLYYEGGTVFVDHGHGLVSIFLHMSELGVNVGDVLEPGDAIGKIGATGRVTGAHLHWAVKWRNTASETRDGDFYIDPALLLELPR